MQKRSFLSRLRRQKAQMAPATGATSDMPEITTKPVMKDQPVQPAGSLSKPSATMVPSTTPTESEEQTAPATAPTVTEAPAAQAEPMDTSVPKPPAMPPTPTVQPVSGFGQVKAAQPTRKAGTGFTNINRVLDANRNSRLGQTVGSGITGQVQNVRSAVQTAQEKFQEEADKNRVDTEANRGQRQSILDRFNPENYKPDESQFKLDAGIQSTFDTRRQELERQRQETEQRFGASTAFMEQQLQMYDNKMEQQRQGVRNRIAQLQEQRSQEEAAYNERYGLNDPDRRRNLFEVGPKAYYNNELDDEIKKLQRALDTDRIGVFAAADKTKADSLRRSLEAVKAAQTGELGAFSQRNEALEADFARMSDEQKQNWIQQQIDAGMQANLPTDQEMSLFDRLRSGAYTGPNELEDVGSLLGKAQQTEQIAGLSRSAGGQEELLRRFVGGKDYTQGQRRLDQTILGQEQGNELSRAARQTRGTVSDVERANMVAAEKAQELVGQGKQFAKETTGLLEDAQDPVMTQVNNRLAKLQGMETNRAETTGRLKNILEGTGEFSSMAPLARAGIALQDAQNMGYLSAQEAQELAAPGGLLSRGLAAGADINKLLSERIQQSQAQGLDATNAASDAQRAALSALNRLSGRLDSDTLYSQDSQYQSGRTGFDLTSLDQEIRRLEASKGIASPAARQQAPGRPDYGSMFASGSLNTANTIYNPTVGANAAFQAADAVLANPLNPAGAVGDIYNLGSQYAAGAAQNAADAAIGAAGTGNQITTDVLKSVLNLAGGDSNTARQLNNALSLYQQANDTGLGLAYQASRDLTGAIAGAGQGIASIGQGNIGAGISQIAGSIANPITNAISNVGSAVSTAIGGGKTGDWPGWKFTVNDVNTGKPTQVAQFANKSSKEILNQIMSQQQVEFVNAKTKNTAAGGARVMNTLLDYYNAALQREKQNTISDETKKTAISYDPKDVERFMDRLKASSYNYKDEVKDSPMASKNRELGVMAQDLEKSKLGKESVKNTPNGKIVDYDNLGPKMMASIANLNERLKNIEKK